MTILSFDATDTGVTQESTVTRMQYQKSGRISRRSQLMRSSVNVLLVSVCVLTGLSAIGSVAGWWRSYTVLSGSMRPGIRPGDVEILRPEATTALRVGQIVAIHPAGYASTVSHRVIAIRHGTGDESGVWITTKGDANNVADPWGSRRLLGPRVWVVRGVVPRVGFLSMWAKTPFPHLFAMITIVLLACMLALKAIWRP